MPRSILATLALLAALSLPLSAHAYTPQTHSQQITVDYYPAPPCAARTLLGILIFFPLP